MTDQLEKNVLITGGSSGIGYSTVRLLSSVGCKIITTARDKEDLHHLNAMEDVIAKEMHLTDSTSITQFIQFIESQEFPIDVMINNAGIYQTGLTMAMQREEIEKLFETNVFSWMELTKQVLPFLVKTEGTIINISSDEGLITTPYSTVYSMTKHAIEAYSRGLKEEVKQYGIEVVVLEPGNIDTEIMKDVNNAVTSQDDVPEYLQDQYQEFKKKLDNLSKYEASARSPDIVAKRIYEILQEEESDFRYFEGNADETKYVVYDLIDKLLRVNHTSNHPITEKDLIDELKGLLARY